MFRQWDGTGRRRCGIEWSMPGFRGPSAARIALFWAASPSGSSPTTPRLQTEAFLNSSITKNPRSYLLQKSNQQIPGSVYHSISTYNHGHRLDLN
jgi:hypothetical protein